MTLTARSFLAAVGAILLTLAGLFWHRRDRLHEAARLRRENSQLEQEIETRVRAASGQDREGRSSTKRERSAAASAIVVNAPTECEYRNEGNSTPQAALQSFAWACDQGDVAAVMRLIRFDQDARIRALAFMAELPEDTRKRWASPEAMAATLLVDAGMRNPFPHADVLDSASAEKISADRVKLHLAGTHRADSEYQLTSDGWKYTITSERVETYLAQSKRR